MANLRKPNSGFTATALAAELFEALRLPPDAHFQVAYSGGHDSHVLLHALASLRAHYVFSLGAIHIDHALQPASADWARHCGRVCSALNIPLLVERIRVDGIASQGLEAAARHARYSAFEKLLAPGEYLFTAHHGDDQAETVLLQLLRGTGIAGLAAMPARASFGAGQIVRPLLAFTRPALQDYAQGQQLKWVEDPSNRDAHHRRNYLRAEIMPRLIRYWPATASMLTRTARHAAEAMQLLNDFTVSDLNDCQKGVTYSPQALSISALVKLGAPRQRNLLRYWIRHQELPTPSTRHLRDVLDQVRSVTRSNHACVRWPGTEIWRYRDQLVAMPALPLPDSALDAVWDPGTPLNLPGIGRLRAMPARGRGLSWARLRGKTLHIRVRHGGEKIVLPGRRHHHVLKKLLQSEGVPPWLRVRLPLLYADRDLVAVADRWVCADYIAETGEEGLKILWEPFSSDVNSSGNVA